MISLCFIAEAPEVLVNVPLAGEVDASADGGVARPCGPCPSLLARFLSRISKGFTGIGAVGNVDAEEVAMVVDEAVAVDELAVVVPQVLLIMTIPSSLS